MDRRQLQRPRQRQRRPTMNNIVRMMAAIAICYAAVCSAFTTPVSLKPSSQQSQHAMKVSNGRTRSRITTRTTTTPTTTTSALQAENKNNKSPQQTADFDYQELQIQMNAMKQQNIKPSQLDPIKRNELRRYVENILAFRQQSSSTTAVDSSVPLHLKLRSSLPGTKWRMAFTTEPLMAEALPADATITMTFASGTGNAATGSNKVDYGLDFFKTLALKRLAVKSTYKVMDVSSNFCRIVINFVDMRYT